MGVDWYACQNEACGETYPDCGNYFTCTGCESSFCSTDCGGRQYVEDEDGNYKESTWGGNLTSCILCRYESVSSRDLIHFLLGKLGLTYEQAEVMCREEAKKNEG